MFTTNFIGIKLMGSAADEMQTFQREIASRAKNSYGFGGVVSHGKSPLHITLVSPNNVSKEKVDEVVSSIVSTHASFDTSLSRPVVFLNERFIASRCLLAVERLQALAHELTVKLDLRPIENRIMHASIVRNITNRADFLSVMSAADEVVVENQRRWPLQMTCHGITVFGRSKQEDPWSERSYFGFVRN